MTSFKQMFEVTLGKMLQTEQRGPSDFMTLYLNSAAVQDGYLDESALKSMWASDTDRRNLAIRANDLVVCEGGDVGRSALIKADSPAIFQNSVHRVRPRRGNDIRFAKYILDALRSSSYLDVLCNKATIRHFTAEKLANLEVPHASIGFQTAACDYLDRETAQIDDLIRKQERLIELLIEKRQAVVTAYVSCSVQPTTEDPGLSLKHLYTVTDERADGAELPLMSVSIHRGLHRRDEITDDEPRAADLSNYKVSRPGDIVINRMRAFQGALGTSNQSGLVSPDYLVIRPSRRVDPTWLAMVLRSKWAVGEMQSRVRGIGSVDQGVIRTPRINVNDLGEIRFRVPSIDSQRSSVAGLRGTVERLDHLSQKCATAVGLLLERRSALISATVTGSLKVQEVC
ncbi:hypothetical protein [Arthrobacter sp. Soil764]|uniref:hypothetical protein n=1 Tax=Arthrobacter sp. Soil764 TaxID=1736403 RepID=UPI0012E3C6FA|nr:hypothetical protein [Arthrobacter sp. Soil764]